LSGPKPGLAQAKRDRMMSDYAQLGENAPHADMIRLNRVLNAAE
jgi:hypothetical protein